MLTDEDRDLIARASVLRETVTMDVIRERTGESTTTMALIYELASVRHLVGVLADRLEQLGS